jgi:hypothetical protein
MAVARFFRVTRDVQAKVGVLAKPQAVLPPFPAIAREVWICYAD